LDRGPFAMIPRFWAESPLRGVELRVAIAIFSYGSGTHPARPSISTVARLTKTPERNVKRAIRKMETLGLIRVVAVPGHPNHYEVVQGQGVASRDTRVSLVSKGVAARDTSGVASRDTQVDQLVDISKDDQREEFQRGLRDTIARLEMKRA
jgi:DNA-binding MarR family transcriptional regulator